MSKRLHFFIRAKFTNILGAFKNKFFDRIHT
jgi:hypothetical protein